MTCSMVKDLALNQSLNEGKAPKPRAAYEAALLEPDSDIIRVPYARQDDHYACKARRT
jgi:hypothetical protein